MSDIDVRVERLPPMRVAWVRVIGPTPETDALERIRPWAEAAGLFRGPGARKLFGFNNPSPMPGDIEYGYEFWVSLDEGTVPPEGIGVKEFPGGVYAVTTCTIQGIETAWKALFGWVQASGHKATHGQELERILDPLAEEAHLTLDLYLPIEE